MVASSNKWASLTCLLLPLTSAVLRVSAEPIPAALEARGVWDPTCQRIDAETSNATDVYGAGTVHYAQGVHHWASSSSQLSDCVVEVGSTADIGVVLKIVAETNTPFAVKGGGHSANAGFSSTEGVHISLAKYSDVKYDSASKTAEIGAGLIWDDVYEKLEPYGVNVVGGRVSGVGVAGFTLGGGYSWLTNQHGLTADNMVAYELVKPDGTVATVTARSDPELWFGLRGGMNNFGIVTKFTMKTFPQTQVWGGLITYTFNTIDEVSAATEKFSANVKDPKAAILTTYNFVGGQPGISLLIFYDWPTQPEGIFDEFLAIPHFTKDVKTRSFLSLVTSSPVQVTTGLRAHFQMVPVLEYTPEFLKAVVNQTNYWGTRLTLLSGAFFSFAAEPFQQDIYTHSLPNTRAYPPTGAQFFSPFNIFFGWTDPFKDDLFTGAVVQSANALVAAATAQGQSNLAGVPLYPNYASKSVSVEQVWGANLPRLKALKRRVDPNNVMGLAGGFKV
ncbi:FAD-binding domain-containing protein [Ephemerocybe angulata]|uniref:FAD-binding domain-containing protein n=1 Tax=Ephemerocybe angulata TaxID=980116 RepID=A0A8H6IBE4_9AGAR|nr:FAD-binding domain-containing protein [Tulosesus angulatus]